MANQRNPSTTWVSVIIVGLAGFWTLFHLIWNVAGQASYDYWDIALLILFALALILAFI